MASDQDNKFSRDDVSMARQFDQVMGQIAAKSRRVAQDMSRNASIYEQIRESLSNIDKEMKDFRSEALKYSSVQKGILNQMQFLEALSRRNDTALMERNGLTRQLLAIDEDILSSQIAISEEADTLNSKAHQHYHELTQTQKILRTLSNVETSITNMVSDRAKHQLNAYTQLQAQYTQLQDLGKELKKQRDSNKDDADVADKYAINLSEQYTTRKLINALLRDIDSSKELKTEFEILKNLKETNTQRRAQLDVMRLQEIRNAEMVERQDTINEIFGVQLGTIKKLGHELSHIVHSPLGAILAVANGIHEVFDEWIEGISETREELGLSYNQAIQFGALTTHNMQSYLLFGNKTTEMLRHMTEHLGHMPHFTGESVKEMTKFASVNNIAVAEAAALAANLDEIPGMTEKMIQDSLKYAQALGEANHIPIGQLTKTIAANTEDFALFASKGAKNVLEAATFAKKLGVEFSTITNTAKQLLDFESSVTKQVETSALLGREVNFDRARQLALSNDLVGMQKEIIKQLGSESEWNRLNIIQRQSIAESLGMSVLETEKLIKNQKYGQEGLEAQAKAAEKLNDLMMIMSRIFSSTTFEIALAGVGMITLIARYQKLKEFGVGVIGDFRDGFKALGKDIMHVLSLPFKLLAKPFNLKASFGKIKMPSINIPTIKLPKLSWPSIPSPKLPKLSWPSIPSLKLPKLSWPSLPAWKWPVIKAPKLPSISFSPRPIEWNKVFGIKQFNSLISQAKLLSTKFFNSLSSDSNTANRSTNVLIKTLSSLKTKLLEITASEKIKNFFGKILPKRKIEPEITTPDISTQTPKRSIGQRITDTIGKMNMTNVIKGAAALAILAGSLFIVGKALTEFEHVGWESVGKGIVALTSMAAIASLLQKASKEMIVGSVGIAALGLSLIPVSESLQTFSNVDWKSIGVGVTGLLAFSAATIALGAVMSSGAGALVFGAGVLAIAALGGSLLIFGTGMQSTAKGIHELSVNIKPLSENILSLTNNVDELFILAAGLTAVGAGLTALGIGGIAALPGIAALTALAKVAEISGISSPSERVTKPTTELPSRDTEQTISVDNSQIVNKLDELINLMKQPGVVNLDGRKVGEAIRLATPQSTAR